MAGSISLLLLFILKLKVEFITGVVKVVILSILTFLIYDILLRSLNYRKTITDLIINKRKEGKKCVE